MASDKFTSLEAARKARELAKEQAKAERASAAEQRAEVKRAIKASVSKTAFAPPLTIDDALSDPVVLASEKLWREIMRQTHEDLDLLSQAKRAASSVALNVAEGMGHTTAGKRIFHYNVARGSAFECTIACKLLGLKAAFVLARNVANDLSEMFPTSDDVDLESVEEVK